MDVAASVQRLRSGKSAEFPAEATTLAFAQSLDAQDVIGHLRNEFIIPTRKSMKKTALDGTIPGQKATAASSETTNGTTKEEDQEIIYFVGNSLGAQPKAVREYVHAQLETWCSIGVNGHFRTLDNSPLTSWLTMAEDCSRKFAPIVGASPDEIVTMNSLTMNLHLMMASFYKPTPKRHKIILEWKPFPSDHYAIESQITWHGLDPKKSMVQLTPDNANFYISTDQILAAIDEHAEETALLLLPGIQYWSGQLFDIPRITAHAQSLGIVVGWDLAHGAGNVELSLHDWNVDFACWCTYKYLNAGPGAIAGAFIHERHGRVTFDESTGAPIFRPRLTGWYGGDLSVRFNMDNKFLPTPGASGYQCANPSAIDMAALSGALSVFEKTDMKTLRDKAVLITAYAEYLLDDMVASEKRDTPSFRIITPHDPRERGTQLSVLLREGLLDRVQANLEEAGIVCDKRKPDVIRVAPVSMYTRYVDVWRFMETLRKTLDEEETQ
ncbi:pyridoxal phosphate-dependent transferase [Microdochium trichocladiopsis]|uniref:Kynureninase n=1 Tax=Microdochium trichocladiopsis TaxID=1682393 RepID=A0A9P8YCS5_9PEZI|nr:pyridoxal phosphate-dependent transferase [Microdochium trichocladiopsis]KAH7037070.1 pyridoxal phosphate-dependent transferase [Microdochium trichocladiopsis]